MGEVPTNMFSVREVPCDPWPRALNSNGYGTVTLPGGRNTTAQRWTWEQHYGPIPEGFEVDHLCENRACVEITHLQLLTHRENTLKGSSPSAKAARATHCAQGHEFTDENTRWNHRTSGKTQRVCRICAAAASRAWRHQHG
jgi:HNH endonuclease